MNLNEKIKLKDKMKVMKIVKDSTDGIIISGDGGLGFVGDGGEICISFIALVNYLRKSFISKGVSTELLTVAFNFGMLDDKELSKLTEKDLEDLVKKMVKELKY